MAQHQSAVRAAIGVVNSITTENTTLFERGSVAAVIFERETAGFEARGKTLVEKTQTEKP